MLTPFAVAARLDEVHRLSPGGGARWLAAAPRRVNSRPRLEVGQPMSELLLCYLYLYVGFGAVFWIGVAYAWKQGDVGPDPPRRRRNLVMLVGGLAVYMVVHGFFQFVAPGL